MDAGRIADFIAAALAGNTEFNGAGDDAILEERAAGGDFLILTRTTGQLATYAKALEERGLPFDIVGGERLGQADEVRAVTDVLEAVYTPENPIPLLGYLRGPFVGLGDDELYSFRRAGGRFEYAGALPAGLSDELAGRLEDAFGRLARIARWMSTRAPAPAFELMLEDLGLAAFAATRKMGSTRAGNLLRLQALVRLWEDQGMHWGRILEEMRELIADPDYRVEEMTLEAGQEDVVRLMNLHQVKGLEGRVVFLADPGDTSAENRLSRQGPEFHAARRGVEPFLSLPVRRPRGPHHSEIIAEPQGWPEDAERETQFLRAEALRLLYVAATRARNLLVVSCYEGKPDRGPWAALGRHLQAVPELAVPDVAEEEREPDPQPIRPLDWEEGRRERCEHWQRVRRPTYARSSVTDEDRDDRIELATGDGWGTEYGSVVHRLFRVAVDGGLPRDETAYIRFLIGSARLDEALAGPAHEALQDFRSSEIWDEVQRAAAVFSEVPFAVSGEEDGGPRVVRGVVDLAYRVPGGWKIVDYKTNRAATDEELATLVDRYASQIRAYARHWQDLTGDPVLEKGLWFTTAGRWRGLAN